LLRPLSSYVQFLLSNSNFSQTSLARSLTLTEHFLQSIAD
jgi:hypothetical protein